MFEGWELTQVSNECSIRRQDDLIKSHHFFWNTEYFGKQRNYTNLTSVFEFVFCLNLCRPYVLHKLQHKPSCPLRLISSTSSDLWSPFSSESSLCLYPCSFFTSRVIVTRQQGGDPIPHSRPTDLAMDTGSTVTNLITPNGLTKLWPMCSSCAVYGYLLIQRLVSPEHPRAQVCIQRLRQERSEAVYIQLTLSVVCFYCRTCIHSISSESVYHVFMFLIVMQWYLPVFAFLNDPDCSTNCSSSYVCKVQQDHRAQSKCPKSCFLPFL